MRTNAAAYLRLTALVIACGMLFAAAPARADSFSLGEAGEYNLFVFGSINSYNTDTEGRVAAGGSVMLTGYGVGSSLGSSFTGSSLVVGGSLGYTNGQVFAGNVEVGGTASLTSVGTSSTATVSDNVSKLSVSFNDEKQNLTQLSQDLASQQATGSAELEYGGIKVSGDGVSDVQIFYLEAEDLLNANSWANFLSSIPDDSNVIFNVSGENVSISNQGMQALSLISDRVLFNFFEAKILTLSSIGFEGSILAPNADVAAYNGNVEGTLIANSFTGTMEFHNNLFTPPETGTSETPEPATMFLLGPALGGLAWYRRRKERIKAKA
jgi:choice-of-anchor A domain-containing protein